MTSDNSNTPLCSLPSLSFLYFLLSTAVKDIFFKLPLNYVISPAENPQWFFSLTWNRIRAPYLGLCALCNPARLPDLLWHLFPLLLPSSWLVAWPHRALEPWDLFLSWSFLSSMLPPAGILTSGLGRTAPPYHLAPSLDTIFSERPATVLLVFLLRLLAESKDFVCLVYHIPLLFLEGTEALRQ